MEKVTAFWAKNKNQILLLCLFMVFFISENISAVYLSTGMFYPWAFVKFITNTYCFIQYAALLYFVCLCISVTFY